MENRIKSYKELNVWKQSIGLVKEAYRVTNEYPKSEVYGLTSQIRRAAVSVPANIAEGQGCSGKKEFLQFLNIAKGSLAELETLFIISKELNYMISDESYALQEECQSITRQVSSLINSLKNKSL